MQDKLYVIVRGDLTPGQKAVQAGHALAQWLIDKPHAQSDKHNKHSKHSVWNNGILVYLQAKSASQLRFLRTRLTHEGHAFAEFTEPDMGNELTAIAALGPVKYFKRLPLLT